MSQEKENQEIKFIPQELAISTTVHYPGWYAGEVDWTDKKRLSDKVRGDIALETIQKAKDKGYQIIVVDSEASLIFTQKLNELEIRRLSEEKRGMSAGRQLGFKEASAIKNVKYLCWTEPEKISLIDYLPDLVRPIIDGTADVVIPKRREKEFQETYPDYQIYFEKQSYHLWSNMLRKFGILPENTEDLDTFFGPKIWRNMPEVSEIFLTEYVYIKNHERSSIFNKSYRPDQYSNSTQFPIIMALFKKLRVINVEIPYKHPERQTKIESDNDAFREKRLNQQRQIIRTCADFCRRLVGTESNTFLQSRSSI